MIQQHDHITITERTFNFKYSFHFKHWHLITFSEYAIEIKFQFYGHVNMVKFSVLVNLH